MSNIKELRDRLDDLESYNAERKDDNRSDFDIEAHKVEKLLDLESKIHDIKIKDDRAMIEMGRSELEIERHDQRSWFKRIDPNVLITSGVGLVGTLLVLHYEKLSVVTSKAFSKVFRFK